MSAHAARAPRHRRLRLPAAARALPRPSAGTLLTVGVGLIVAALAFAADGGLRLGRTTWAELALLLGSGALLTGALLAGPRPRRAWGAWSAGLFLLLAAVTAASVSWAVNPSDAWVEANRTLAYAATFVAALVAAQVAPHRWSALLGGVVLGTVVVSAWALTSKVFPGLTADLESYARLREPFDYWNAVGLMAALGVPGCLWLGGRRRGHAAVTALAVPALGILVLTILLSYSRGALLAAGLGAALWFALVPLRLRALAVLAPAVAGALVAASWAFGQSALTEDAVPLALRTDAGHQFGVLLLAMVAVLAVAGLAIGFTGAVRPPHPTTRQRVGIGALVALALVPVGLAVGLAFSDRGLSGSVSSGWEQLTDPAASSPGNDPGRLTAVGSVRARYWDESLQMFSEQPLVGVGAGGYATVRPRFREDELGVRHAHGYVPQTLADLGVVGLGVSLALLGAWLVAALRSTGLRRDGPRLPHTPERVGLLTLLATVLVFGVHSFLDWTWFVPATAVTAMLCAGWLAGRGPLDEPAAADGARGSLRERLRAGLRSRPRAVGAAGLVAATLLAGWTVWQPLRASNAVDAALAAAAEGDVAQARELAATARDRNPVSVEPLLARSTAEVAAGDLQAARGALVEAVRLQPGNPEPWIRLAELELFGLERPERALQAAQRAAFLDPRSDDVVQLFLQVRRAQRGLDPRVQPQPGGAPSGAAPGGAAAPQPAPPDTATP